MKKILLASLLILACSAVATKAEAVESLPQSSIDKQFSFEVATPAVVDFKITQMHKVDADVVEVYSFIPSVVYVKAQEVHASQVPSIVNATLPFRRCNGPPTLS